MSYRTLQVDDALYSYLIEHSVRERQAQRALLEASAAHPQGGM